MDPYAVLGLPPDASEEEVEAAYRDLAKQLHPDVAVTAEAQARMAMVNAARDAIRERGRASRDTGGNGGPPPATRLPDGHWLSERIRAGLPPELLRELDPYEDVRLVTAASMWQDPLVVLAVTDRRLLWAPQHTFSPRVHVLRHDEVAAVSHRVRRPLRRRAVVQLATRAGRKVSFGDVEPDAAALIARNVADGMA